MYYLVGPGLTEAANMQGRLPTEERSQRAVQTRTDSQWQAASCGIMMIVGEDIHLLFFFNKRIYLCHTPPGGLGWLPGPLKALWLCGTVALTVTVRQLELNCTASAASGSTSGNSHGATGTLAVFSSLKLIQ